MKNRAVRSILLIKRGALGDVLLTTPLIRALRKRYPKARIDYMTGSWSAKALTGNPDLSHVIEFRDSPSLLALFFFMLPAVIRAKAVRYDMVFALDKAWQIGLLARLLGRKSIGFDRAGEGFALTDSIPYGGESYKEAPHDIASYLLLGEKGMAILNDMNMVFAPHSQDLLYAKKCIRGLEGGFIAICPGGAKNPYQSMPSRRWPLERYAALASKLVGSKIPVVILGSTADQEEAQYIVNYCKKHPLLVSLAGKTTIGQAAAIFSLSKGSVCHDTALMHLASAMGTPVVALFGPTNPMQKQPLNPGSSTVWDDTVCQNCNKRVCYVENKELDPGCGVRMDRILVDDVLHIALSILNT